jgi:hypothetical protein
MTLEERLQYCRICENRQINPAIGLVCNLTNEKPAFENKCATLVIDQKEADRLVQLERQAKEEEEGGAFSPEKKAIQKGVLGGLAMIAIAVVWFVVGWMSGYIYFYPPILFVIGVYALIKGIAKGNISGNRNKS